MTSASTAPKCATLAAIRQTIGEREDIDGILLLGKNLTSSHSAWDWANFLHTFGSAWAPIEHPPPSPVVSAVTVRRNALGTESPLKEGEWELRLIPRLYSRGRFAYSNEIYVDHVKPSDFTSTVVTRSCSTPATVKRPRSAAQDGQGPASGKKTSLLLPLAGGRAFSHSMRWMPVRSGCTSSVTSI